MKFLRICLTVGCLVLLARLKLAADSLWVEVRSPNFSVITDAGDKRGRDVALHFEQMRSVFGTLMTQVNVSQSVPLQIVAFRTSKEMRQMTPVFDGKPTEMAGLFQGGDDRSFIMLDMSVENPWSVVFHEYAHQLMNSNLSIRTDPWFEEGFAEYFTSIEVDNKEARVGRIPEDTYRILQEYGLMRVADLLRVQHNSKTYNETGSHRNVFYAESSLLVHYLYDSRLIPKLADYFAARIDQKEAPEQAIQQAFGMTTEQLDTILHDYLKAGRFKYFPIPTPSGIVAAQFSETPVSLADARALLADIDAHSLDHHDRALGEFEDVLKSDPDNVAALRGTGYVYLRQKDYDHAREFLQRASEHGSNDSRLHYYNALLMNESLIKTGGAMNGVHADEMKRELQTAIALDPKLADAYSLLGWAQAASGEPEKGLATMKKAVELSPRNEIYQINLANIYMTNHKVDEAIALLHVLNRSANPQVASRAAAALAQAEDFKEQTKLYELQVQKGPAENVVVRREVNTPPGTVEGEIQVEATPMPPSVHFMKGKISAVDCSGAPQAWITVVSAGRSFKFHVGDTKHVTLLGADRFSCDWKDKRVALNYRERPNETDDVVSLELQ